MVNDPFSNSKIEPWLIDSVGRIVVQAEVLNNNFKNIKDLLADKGKEIVLAFKTETPWAPVCRYGSIGRPSFIFKR